MAAATIFDRLLYCAREATKGTSGFGTGVNATALTHVATNTAVTTAAAAVNAAGQGAGLNSDLQAVKVRTLKVQPNITSVARPVIKGSMGPAHNVISKQSMQVDMEIELKGSGTAGTAPEYTPIFEACGLTPALVATTSVAFTPSGTIATLTNAVTLRVFYDGMLYEVTGCAGTLSVDMTIGNILVATVSLQGSYIAPTVAAISPIALAAMPYDASAPIVGGTVDVINDGLAVAVAAFKMDTGNSIQEHFLTNGEHTFAVADRAPTLTLTKDSVGTPAEWTALIANTATTVSGAFTSGGAGNSLAFGTALLGARRSAVAYGERAERDTLDVTYGLFEINGNDQYHFTFT